MSADVIYEGRGFRARRAAEADGPALCELVRKVHIRGALDVTQERDPDFFALPRMHLGPYDVWLIENDDGQVGACGSVTVRDGWFDGAIRKVGYLSDLRILPGFRGGRAMPLVYRRCLEEARDRHGAEVFYTVIFDENEVAKRALVARSERREGRRREQPVYKVMTPFRMTSVQFTKRKAAPTGKVDHATERDVEALVEFLAKRQAARLMGEVYTEQLLRDRLAAWPGFVLESFLLARDARGRIVGATAPWDTHPFKRTRVLGYYGQMRWVKGLFDASAWAFGFTPLPAPGECFRFPFLSHLEVEDDDPSVLRDLLLAAYRERRDQHLHFMSAMIPRGSPLEGAFSGLTVRHTPMTVYGVSLAGSPHNDYDFRTLHPGFEIALS